MTWALDASAALGLVLGDGDETFSSLVSARLQQEPAFVPQHWVLEVNNGLLMAVRRGRLPESAALRAQQLLLELPIIVDMETGARCWSTSYELARRFDLTLYDAAYFELALRLEADLATADRSLSRAARAAGVIVMGPDAAAST